MTGPLLGQEVRRLRVDVLHQHGHGRRGVEGRLSGQQLVGEDAQRVDVAARVGGLAGRPLRRDVAGGSEDQPRLRGLGLIVAPQHAGDAEVEHLHDIGVAGLRDQDDVLGLQVAVHHALRVGLTHAVADLRHDVERAVHRERAVALEHVQQRSPAQELHDDVEAAVGQLPGQEHPHHVGMVERGRDAGLAFEAPHGVAVVGQLGVEDLDGDVAVERGLPRAVHRSHPAGPDLLLELELVEQRLSDVGVDLLLGQDEASTVLLAEGSRRIVPTPALGAGLGEGVHGAGTRASPLDDLP